MDSGGVVAQNLARMKARASNTIPPPSRVDTTAYAVDATPRKPIATPYYVPRKPVKPAVAPSQQAAIPVPAVQQVEQKQRELPPPPVAVAQSSEIPKEYQVKKVIRKLAPLVVSAEQKEERKSWEARQKKQKNVAVGPIVPYRPLYRPVRDLPHDDLKSDPGDNATTFASGTSQAAFDSTIRYAWHVQKHIIEERKGYVPKRVVEWQSIDRRAYPLIMKYDLSQGKEGFQQPAFRYLHPTVARGMMLLSEWKTMAHAQDVVDTFHAWAQRAAIDLQTDPILVIDVNPRYATSTIGFIHALSANRGSSRICLVEQATLKPFADQLRHIERVSQDMPNKAGGARVTYQTKSMRMPTYMRSEAKEFKHVFVYQTIDWQTELMGENGKASLQVLASALQWAKEATRVCEGSVAFASNLPQQREDVTELLAQVAGTLAPFDVYTMSGPIPVVFTTREFREMKGIHHVSSRDVMVRSSAALDAIDKLSWVRKSHLHPALVEKRKSITPIFWLSFPNAMELTTNARLLFEQQQSLQAYIRDDVMRSEADEADKPLAVYTQACGPAFLAAVAENFLDVLTTRPYPDTRSVLSLYRDKMTSRMGGDESKKLREEHTDDRYRVVYQLTDQENAPQQAPNQGQVYTIEGNVYFVRSTGRDPAHELVTQQQELVKQRSLVFAHRPFGISATYVNQDARSHDVTVPACVDEIKRFVATVREINREAGVIVTTSAHNGRSKKRPDDAGPSTADFVFASLQNAIRQLARPVDTARYILLRQTHGKLDFFYLTFNVIDEAINATEKERTAALRTHCTRVFGTNKKVEFYALPPTKN